MENNNTKKFSIQDIDLYKEDDNVDFAMAKIGFLASGDNGQDSPISEEVLRRDAHTALGKPIVAEYDPWQNDVTTHTTEEVIVGWIPSDSEIEFVSLEDGRVMAFANCLISKIYATDVYELFKRDNYRSVSSEFSCVQDDENGDGTGNVESFEVRGVTILGKTVRPAVEGANIQVKKFSLDNANKLFDEYNNPLKKFADDRRKLMDQEGSKNFPVDTSKDAVDMGDWNGDKAKHDLMDSKNYDSIGDKVCLDFTKGDRKLENCKYPVMNVKDGKWVYSAEGLSSAMAYAAQHDPEVYKKAVSLQKKLGLYKDDKKEDSKKMSEEKKFEIEGREAWGDVIKEVQDHEGKDAYVESVEKDHIIYKIGKDGDRMTVKADVKVGKDDKKVSAKIDWDTKKKDADQKEFADDETDKTDDKDTKDGEGDDSKSKEFEDKDNKDKKEDPKDKEEKKFSFDTYADNGAYASMLDKESEDNKKLAKELAEKDDFNVIMSKLFELNTKCAELKKFKDDIEMSETKDKVDKTLATVKDKVCAEDYKKFYEEGQKCNCGNVEQFVSKVKAFAFDVSIKSNTNTDGIMKFAFGDSTKLQEVDAFEKYLK